MRAHRRTLSGWGCWPAVETDAYRPERLRDLAALLATDTSLLARGLGRSYGDAAVNGAGATVLLERLDRVVAFDDVTGVLSAEAGMSLADVLRTFGPRGWFPPVVPGTKHVTLGGAVACDIHGKNHHVAGSFGRHVERFTLLLASGERRVCSRSENTDAFRATLGGMGLTGIILDVTLRLTPLPAPRLRVDHERIGSLDELLARFDDEDDRWPFSVAWVDAMARDGELGRGVLMRGDWDRDGAGIATAGDFAAAPRFGVPHFARGFLLRRPLMRAFNALYYRRPKADARGTSASIESFFFPLDGIADWNRLYGRRGFAQYQVVLPQPDGGAGIRRLLDEIAHAPGTASLAVLKRLGEGEPGQLLSFPRPGYTLAVDFSLRDFSVLQLFERLDAICIEHGGCVYLAKDARLAPWALRAMYPQVDRWREIRAQLDPHGRFTSDLARRTGLA